VVNVEGTTEVNNEGDDSDSGEKDADEASGIETRNDEILDDEVYHPDSMTPSVR
jgi:hypothetical protein